MYKKRNKIKADLHTLQKKHYICDAVNENMALFYKKEIAPSDWGISRKIGEFKAVFATFLQTDYKTAVFTTLVTY